MKIEVKNPIYLILLNWIILLLGYLGIPLISMVVETPFQHYILSFLAMNFHIFGEQTSITLLITSWIISISIFGIVTKIDWKIPLYGMFSELCVYLFAIILMKRHSLTFAEIKIELLQGFGIICGIISLLYIPIFIRYLIKKRKRRNTVNEIQMEYVSKCPHCGKEYQSNPILCYVCSKRMISL
ncbi:MAG: hypothetical protein EU530_03245 [Promethearchaeota archaeon]|nr:MAG: hypothetical protein EU530_03245 [Candidatus Lokiarchaeota archaeon]